MAVEAFTGQPLAWVSEIDPDASRILAARFDAPNLGDLKAIDWEGMYPMTAPRNNALAQEMYDRYCQGLSIEQVAAEFSRSRQTVWKMFARRGFDLRRRPPARPTVVFNGRAYSIGSQGYYRATSGDRALLHRDVWQQVRGPIPAGWDIHHRDHDKTNNHIGNLECLPKDEHARRYNLGCNGFVHKCELGEVMPSDSPAVDILTAGYP